MLIVRNLSFSYNNQASLKFPDIEIKETGSLLVTGRSGTGKSTMLHLLAGVLRCDDAEINVSGTFINRLKKTATDRFRGKHIGVIFQKPHLIDALSVEDNLKVAQYFTGLRDNGRIAETLEETGLIDKKHKKPSTLSQGEQQRLAIARGLLNQPRLILADEPTSALDDENAMVVAGMLIKQAERFRANLVIATHDHRLKKLFLNQIKLI